MTPQELKNSILQFALQGKLTKQKDSETVDLPFFSPQKDSGMEHCELELPHNWHVGTLESFCEVIPTKPYQILEKQVKPTGKYPVISQSQAYQIGFSDEGDRLYQIDVPVVAFGDHTAVVKYLDFDFIVGADGVKLLKPGGAVSSKYLFYALQLFTFGLEKVGGYSRHYKFIKNKPIPIPPLAEQARIVAKIEELLPYIDRYEQAWNRLEDFNKRFPIDMQKSLLQWAIQGKLVEQRVEEGTAEGVYSEIQGELPFDIPQNWKWARLSDIIVEKPSNGLSPKGVNYKTKVKNLTLTATTSGKFKPDAFKYVDIDLEPDSKYWLKNGDLLIQRSNSRELVGTSCVYTGKDNEYIYPDLMMKLRVKDGISIFYVVYVLKAPLSRFYFSKNASGTSESMPKINQRIVSDTLIPLPPLAEQKRIVAKLEELLPLCERLK